jgi:hypothetical protein
MKGKSAKTHQRKKPQIAYSLPLCNENSIYVFLFLELSGLSPNFYILVSVSDL